MRSTCKSMPKISQSVESMIARDRWWPMKPLTPRIRTRFMAGGTPGKTSIVLAAASVPLLERAQRFGGQHPPVALCGEHREAMAISCARIKRVARGEQALLHRRAVRAFVDKSRACKRDARTSDVAKRARVGRRDGAHEVVDRLRRGPPVDAPVLGRATAEIRAAGTAPRLHNDIAAGSYFGGNVVVESWCGAGGEQRQH